MAAKICNLIKKKKKSIEITGKYYDAILRDWTTRQRQKDGIIKDGENLPQNRNQWKGREVSKQRESWRDETIRLAGEKSMDRKIL